MPFFDGLLVLGMGKDPDLMESRQLLNNIPPQDEFPTPKLLRSPAGRASKRRCQNFKSFHRTEGSFKNPVLAWALKVA
jgi:hypothetical protein